MTSDPKISTPLSNPKVMSRRIRGQFGSIMTRTAQKTAKAARINPMVSANRAQRRFIS